ncbi:DNA mismatch repair endonuclease MutL [Gracilinema caldarium]|uniref:DNA mismatch repair protein MutL n=1 Tax=Gracilinema caldarium (strain ATCC 51460 / DSM 7334 / H1) TaxID=744872 RepID=F8F0S6_GRAC1|nr:DNA mismatch repair endonuclease MutL [Gracilinema caldarium]AEJ19783.1 DNA mismatch repair protein mutL [Gracilinema caldarium DSM 7334]
MESTGIQRRPVHILSTDVARKIAAGEVVDRPAALVRELIDNALDAEAQTIEVQIEGGGVRRTEVIDDGVGMTREDLALCWLPHATSKVASLEDLLSAETLGFRGEALAAITAVAHVDISTSIDGREAWQLSVGPGGFEQAAEAQAHLIQQTRRVRGTTVRVLGLFDSVPARKKFLKRDGAEALLCKQIFIDKAMAFPDRTFRFLQDGNLKLFFPPISSYRERFIQTQCDGPEQQFVHELYAQGEGFHITMVVGGPELYRSDRREQFVFANGRRIQDFALLQALEYGLEGAFPNGTHPIGALFITIDPALADFNIHPAKREVRFKDPGAIHHAITASLKKFIHNLLLSDKNTQIVKDTNKMILKNTGYEKAAQLLDVHNELSQGTKNSSEHVQCSCEEQGLRKSSAAAINTGTTSAGRLAMEALLERPPQYQKLPQVSQSVTYIGQLFGLFLLAEAGTTLYIIDQHAAHERILFDSLTTQPIQNQDLLIPITFETDSEEEDHFLTLHQERLAEAGIVLDGQGQGSWAITALPANWEKSDSETIQDILKLSEAGEGFIELWIATMACHMAIKDGDYVDRVTAQALVEAALALPIPRCPHGRPIWTTVSKDELFHAVRRTE